MIRVAIAAPSAVTRAGLEALLTSHPEFDVVGSGADLLAAASMRPDVVLAAVEIEELADAAETSAAPVVLLGSAGDPVWTEEALRLGARAVLPPDVAAGAIVTAVQAAAAGLAALDPRDLEVLLARAAHLHPPPETAALTARELEVLRMMAEGAANKNIAWKLGISEHTVKFHVASILGKLNAASRTEAVTTGIRKGLILI